MKNRFLMTLMSGLVGLALLSSCSDEEANGRVKVYLTDAPIDGTNVEALFLSVTRIEMKGEGGWKTVKEFSTPLSLDILDYHNGNSYFVTEETIEAGTYSEARLILNAAENGSSPKANPDCYVLYTDGTRKELFVPSGSQSGYKVKGSFTLPPNGTVAVTLDFDARKSIISAGSSGKLLLKPTVRLVANPEAALLVGNFSDYGAYSKVIVYAYEKDTYSSGEAATPADGEARFPNAISSAVVDANGKFTLAFMSAGEYDLILAAHNTQGEFVDEIGKYEDVTLSSGAKLTLNLSLSVLTDM